MKFNLNYDKKDIEKFFRGLEKSRYDMFNKVKFSNKCKVSESEKISYINNSYKAKVEQDILKIYIPEVLPKYKNISNVVFKNEKSLKIDITYYTLENQILRANLLSAKILERKEKLYQQSILDNNRK